MSLEVQLNYTNLFYDQKSVWTFLYESQDFFESQDF